MKKLILACFLLTACTTRTPLIVTAIDQEKYYKDMAKYPPVESIEYYVTINYSVQFYTDSLYQIGDTIK